mgnify:CR=1 FL=1
MHSSGADCVKLQTFKPESITINSRKEDFIVKGGTLWDGQSLYELYKKAYTPWEWHKQLFDVAKEEGLVCFSSPFDKTSVDFLESLNTPAYKIASFEITDIPLIEYVACKMKPIIISTGIASLEDIELALDACRRVGNNEIALLKCTSSYPAPINEANMCMVKDLAERFDVITGLSDPFNKCSLNNGRSSGHALGTHVFLSGSNDIGVNDFLPLAGSVRFI